MEKKITDYLHLYIGGVRVIHDPTRNQDCPEIGTLFPFFWTNVTYVADGICAERFKLALRPLSSMTEDEAKELQILCQLEDEDMDFVKQFTDRFFDGEGESYGSAHLTNVIQWANGVHYLLSKGFDLFGLIDAKLAIDSTTLK